MSHEVATCMYFLKISSHEAPHGPKIRVLDCLDCSQPKGRADFCRCIPIEASTGGLNLLSI